MLVADGFEVQLIRFLIPFAKVIRSVSTKEYCSMKSPNVFKPFDYLPSQ